MSLQRYPPLHHASSSHRTQTANLNIHWMPRFTLVVASASSCSQNQAALFVCIDWLSGVSLLKGCVCMCVWIYLRGLVWFLAAYTLDLVPRHHIQRTKCEDHVHCPTLEITSTQQHAQSSSVLDLTAARCNLPHSLFRLREEFEVVCIAPRTKRLCICMLVLHVLQPL